MSLNLLEELYDQYNDYIDDYQNHEQNNEPESFSNNEINIICQICKTSENLSFDFELNHYTCLKCGFICSSSNNVLNNQYMKENDFKDTSHINVNFVIANTISKNNNMVIKNIFNWNQISIKEMENIKLKKYIVKSCESLGFRKYIIDDIIIFYDLVFNNNYINDRLVLLRGNNKYGLIGSCIYYGCKKNNLVIPIRTIAKTLKITTKVINKNCNVFLKVIDDLKKKSEIYNYEFNISPSVNYLNTFLTNINIKSEDFDFVHQILDRINGNEKFANFLPHHSALLALLTYLKKEKYGFKQQKLCKLLGISRLLMIQLLKIRNTNFDYLYYGKQNQDQDKEVINLKESKQDKNNNSETLDLKLIEEQIKEIEKIDTNDYPNNLKLDYILFCLK